MATQAPSKPAPLSLDSFAVEERRNLAIKLVRKGGTIDSVAARMGVSTETLRGYLPPELKGGGRPTKGSLAKKIRELAVLGLTNREIAIVTGAHAKQVNRVASDVRTSQALDNALVRAAKIRGWSLEEVRARIMVTIAQDPKATVLIDSILDDQITAPVRIAGAPQQ